jgi:ribosomal protein S18 acetylase RimI-like enzyme
MIKFKNMTPEEFDHFAIESKSRYIDEKMKANNLTQDEANKIADADFARILPDGYQSKDNFLYNLMDQENNNVGYLWYCIRGSTNNKKAFIADIMIREKFRGKGYGREAMLLLETDVKSRGLKHIGLHVFGFNEVAIKLYQSMGYQTTDLVMEKYLE